MQIKESELWAPKFDQLHTAVRNHEYTEFVLPGGRNSTKSSVVSENIAYLMQTHKNVSCAIVRKVSNTLRKSVFEQMLWSFDKWHIESRYEHTTSETMALPIVDKKSGQKIVFLGADNPEKIKSIKLSKSYIGILWIEEATEFTEKEIQSIKLSVLRGGEEYGGQYWVFISYNPPSSPRHWLNEYIRHAKKDRMVLTSSYLDLPRNWISEAVWNEIEYTKNTNERAYRNIFLGEPTGTGSNIFENVELRPITDDEINHYEWNYYGIDWGFYPDPFMFVAMSYNAKTKTLYIYDELKLYKHGNTEASEALQEHLKDKYVNPKGLRIIADSAEPKSINDFHSYGWSIYASNKGRGSLEAGMKWLQSLSKIVIDFERCPESADEFSNYEHEINKKTGEIMAGYPDGQPDHAIACVRYALETVWQRKGM